MSTLFDAHAHLLSSDVKRYPPAPLSGTLDAGALDDPITAERLVAMMDEHGVARAAAVQRAHVYGVDNSYVADAAAAHPDRLVALVLVDPLAQDGAAAVRHWLGERGAIGVRLTAPSQDPGLDWLDSTQARPVWDAVAEEGGAMRVHLYGWNRDAGLPIVARLAARYPDTPVVIDHLTNIAASDEPPDYGVVAAMRRVAERSNVSTIFSTINVAKAQAAGVALAPVVRRVVDAFGADRVMWGSDVGQSKPSYADMIAMAREAVALLSEAERAKVLHDTAARIHAPR